MKNENHLIQYGRRLAIFLMVCLLSVTFSDLNSVEAREKQIIVDSAKFDADQPKFALLVGITNYKNKKLNRIDGCENNIALLSETLVKDYGFKTSNVLSLSDEQATKNEIIKNFRNHLITNAAKSAREKKEAVIVYYFCGHGSQYQDQDRDENDGKDETFVAYDSRTDGVFDILDDELDDLKAELRPFTKNTTLILESCHSGTGSRGDSQETLLVSEETEEDTRERTPYKRKFPPTTEADALTYTEVAASLSINTAKSETAEFCACVKPMSLMTKALIQGLKRATYSTTYRQLVREISGEVSVNSRQEPQVEGNRDAVLFGGGAKRAKPYIEIEKILPKNRIIIAAGKIHGLKEGSQITIYSSESLTNTGQEGWLTNGVVEKVADFQAVVQLPEIKTNPKVKDVKITSHAILASPIFGGGSILVELNGARAKNNSAEETGLFKEVEEKLKKEGLTENGLVQIYSSKAATMAERRQSKGILRLRKGKIGEIFQGKNKTKIPDLKNIYLPTPQTYCEGNVLKTDGGEIKIPPPETEVYYLDDGIAGGVPLYGRFFDPAKADISEKIKEMIRDFALQTNLRGLDNAASDLNRQVKISWQTIPLKLDWRCQNGQKKPVVLSQGKPQPLIGNNVRVETFFQLKVKNISGDFNRKIKNDEFAAGEPLHVTVLAMKNSGEIEIVYPSLGANDPVADGDEVKSLNNIVIKSELPVGVEHYLVIISKKYVDFSFYESKGIKRRLQSPLERILTQSGNKSRNAESIIPDAPNQWSVIHFEMRITEN